MRPAYEDSTYNDDEITLVDAGPWFLEDLGADLDPDGLRDSTSALRASLDRLESNLAS